MIQNLMGAAGRAGSEEAIVRFKAGKCETEPRAGGKLWVKPMARRGEVQLVKVDDLMHFQWRDRATLSVDASCDYVVFPGDATFQVDTGREGDRVYALQYGANASRRFFFWMQTKDSGEDDALVARLNAAMNGEAGSAPAPAPNGTEGAGLGGVLRRLRDEGAEPETAQQQPSAITLEGLQSVMQNLGLPPVAQQPRQSSADAPPAPADGVSSEAFQRAMAGALTAISTPLSLTDILTPANIQASAILDDDAIVSRLVEHLPESQRSQAELVELARRPQFRQAIHQLAQALRAPDNVASIFANFGLQPQTDPDPIRAFLAAIQAAAEPPDANMEDAPPHIDHLPGPDQDT